MYLCVRRNVFQDSDNRGFLKIDHSGIDTRIVLKINKFSKKVSSNRDRTLHPRTVLTSCIQSHALPSVLIPIA